MPEKALLVYWGPQINSFRDCQRTVRVACSIRSSLGRSGESEKREIRLLGARPAPRSCDLEAQPQPQQSPPTTSGDAAATPIEAAPHTSHRRHPVKEIGTRGTATCIDEKMTPPLARQ
ncbi:hypothetical protein NDU88_007412 [Pleurodeles waltl]|uniref:Uncharacterized protein n=1 Tax=Pleurodeles waltl TaxID=8319 RepID=A0AAV7U0D7_PLEWA|nr:hypothetical protein NDU88_007412 [Pleurodeles waltl]